MSLFFVKTPVGSDADGVCWTKQAVVVEYAWLLDSTIGDQEANGPTALQILQTET